MPPSPIKVQVFISSIIQCRWEPASCQRALIHNRFRLIREGVFDYVFLRGRIPLPQSELFIYRLWHLFPSLRKAFLNYSFSNVCVRSDDIQIQLTTVCLNILLDSWPSQCFNSGSCSKPFFSAGTPYTKTTETYIYRTIDETLFFVIIAFASLGIVYGLICLLTLVLNFKKKYVYYWTVIKNQFETRNPKWIEITRQLLTNP